MSAFLICSKLSCRFKVYNLMSLCGSLSWLQNFHYVTIVLKFQKAHKLWTHRNQGWWNCETLVLKVLFSCWCWYSVASQVWCHFKTTPLVMPYLQSISQQGENDIYAPDYNIFFEQRHLWFLPKWWTMCVFIFFKPIQDRWRNNGMIWALQLFASEMLLVRLRKKTKKRIAAFVSSILNN